MKLVLLTLSLSFSLLIAELYIQVFYDAHFVLSGWNRPYLEENEINLHGSRGRKIKLFGN
jgi:hypothetical protein